jgi:ribonuclease BN (tRNA processing enzyme)
MKVHLLGTAGYHPAENRQTTCCILPAEGVVLDAGTGFFRVRDLVQTPELHVFLSHAHLDHCVGLSYYLSVVHERNIKRIFVYGEAEKLNAIRQHLFTNYLFPIQPVFQWVPLGREEIRLPGGARLRPFPLVHPGGTLGFRIEWPDRSMAYVTDTTAHADAAYVRQIEGVDLLLHECHFSDGFEELAKTTGHSCLKQVAEVSRAARVGRTVLIHLNPLNATLDLESVGHVFDRMVAGVDQMEIEF